MNDTALHLRADENAMVSPAARGSAPPKGSARVRAVALASGAEPYHPRALRHPATSSSTSASPYAMSPSVSVPVLSRQMTSTRASPSTAGSSFTSTWREARRAAPTAKAIEVMSTRPRGIIAVTDAIVAVTASTHAPERHACCHPPTTCICALSTSRPTGPIAHPTQPSTRSIESRSSEPTSENRFASPAKAFA